MTVLREVPCPRSDGGLVESGKDHTLGHSVRGYEGKHDLESLPGSPTSGETAGCL